MNENEYQLKKALIHQETEWREKFQALLNENAEMKLHFSEQKKHIDEIKRLADKIAQQKGVIKSQAKQIAELKFFIGEVEDTHDLDR